MKPEDGNSYVQMRCGNKRVTRATSTSYRIVCAACGFPQGRSFLSRQQAAREALLRSDEPCEMEGCTDGD